MNPTRRYHKQDDRDLFISGSPSRSKFTVEEGDDQDPRYQLNKNEAVIARVNHGSWRVADPEIGYYPEDENGENKLFTASPSTLTSLYGTSKITPRAVEHALALAHQESTKHGSGALTYAYDLSDDSSPLVLHALQKGYLVENPEHSLEALEREAANRKTSSEYANGYYLKDARKAGRRTSDITTRIAMDNSSYGEELPENAGQEAVNRVRESVARRNAQRELPEPEQAPVEHEGSLWDHASRKDKNSWNEPLGLPTTSRAGAFKNYVGGIVSKVRGN